MLLLAIWGIDGKMNNTFIATLYNNTTYHWCTRLWH